MLNSDDQTKNLLYSVGSTIGGDSVERMMFGKFGRTRKGKAILRLA
jgi:hypothetical protein